MKKLTVILLAVFMVFGMSTAGSAAITFGIDFYGLPGYDQGVMDTGDVITLQPCNTINIDLWVYGVPAEGLPGYGFGFGVLPGAEINFAIDKFTVETGMNSGESEIFPGGVYIESLFWPPGTLLDGDFLMASLELHCTAISFDELWIYDYLPESTQWVLGDGSVIDGQILPQYLAAVNQVPIPGAVWLLGSGLVGLMGFMRRRS